MTHELLKDFSLFSLFFAFAIGIAVTCLAWIISKKLADIPSDDRTYKDPPPLGFRLTWLPISWIGHFLQNFLPTSRQTAVGNKLRKAGLDYCINPVQFEASRLVAAGFSLLIAYWLVGSFSSNKHVFSASEVNVLIISFLCGWLYPAIWLNDRLNARKKELLRSLPFFLDIITLCVEAGLNMQGAINQAVLKGPKGAMRDELQRLLRDVRAGKGRAVSLRDMADRLDEAPITNFVTAVIQAEQMGMNLGPVLRAQADQRRVERFNRAEKLAMEAPVKMLLPLIAFIFPCTFIVLFFPIAMQFMHSGI